VSEARGWLVSYFERHGKLNGRDVDELVDENFVSMELLDSLGIVEMLTGIEDEFGVWLEPSEMQDPRFCSIAGLAELVEESRARAS
jgi:acyl carrier protein